VDRRKKALLSFKLRAGGIIQRNEGIYKTKNSRLKSEWGNAITEGVEEGSKGHDKTVIYSPYTLFPRRKGRVLRGYRALQGEGKAGR